MTKNRKRVIYIIGSLENTKVAIIANQLRKDLPNCEIFDSWRSPGEFADTYWRKYEKAKGLSYKEALGGWAAQQIFNFDKTHLDRATDVVLIAPCGKSCHLELGYSIASQKRAFYFFEKEPKRWDVMVNFVPIDNICISYNELIQQLKKY